MNTPKNPQHPLPNNEADPSQAARLLRMLRKLRDPLHKFMIETMLLALLAWQAMTDQEKSRYA
jgi:hypothetical protein